MWAQAPHSYKSSFEISNFTSTAQVKEMYQDDSPLHLAEIPISGDQEEMTREQWGSEKNTKHKVMLFMLCLPSIYQPGVFLICRLHFVHQLLIDVRQGHIFI